MGLFCPKNVSQNKRPNLSVPKTVGFDENFKHHKFDGYPIAGVENGYGVYGSVVVDSVDVFVID